MTYQNIKKIIFTGPESTGKSTAAIKFSKLLKLPLVDEFARSYLNAINGEYKMKDLYEILEGQYLSEERAHIKSSVIICDTDWLTIDIWANDVFNKGMKPPDDLSTRYYYVCPPDIPWQPDPLRENPNDRDRLFDLYIEKLNELNLSYEIYKR